MNVLILVGVMYWLLVLVLLLVYWVQFTSSDRKVDWGSSYDWLLLLIAYTLGPFFIISQGTMFIVMVWTGLMVMSEVGLILHLLDKPDNSL